MRMFFIFKGLSEHGGSQQVHGQSELEFNVKGGHVGEHFRGRREIASNLEVVILSRLWMSLIMGSFVIKCRTLNQISPLWLP
jgi:hypothetical protein